MTKKVNILLPSATFFSNGDVPDGLFNLILQCTIIFWPLALDWARRFRAKVIVERALNEIARAYKLPPSTRQKRFAVIAEQMLVGADDNRRDTARFYGRHHSHCARKFQGEPYGRKAWFAADHD